MNKVKRKNSTGPSAKSEMFYFDDLMNPVTRDRATWAVFRELDEKGNLVFEAQGFID
ncbi:MAG: hypothetical protein AB9879_12925 [Methanothrix sp.]|jgi:hypothetical protein